MKLSLRTNILRVVALLLLILIIISAWSVLNFKKLKNSIEDIMQANYKSIKVTQEMMVALEKQDSAELYYIYSNPNQDAQNIFRENEKIFMMNLGIEEDNITEVGEEDAAKAIDGLYTQYLDKFNVLITNSDYQYYYKEILPIFEQIQEECRVLTQLNQDGMESRQEKANKTAQDATYATSIICLAAIFVGIALAFYVVNSIIKSVDGLTEAIVRKISDGIMVMDADKKIILINEAGEDYISLNEEEIKEKHFLEVIEDKSFYEFVYRKNPKKDEYYDMKLINKNEEKYLRIITTSISEGGTVVLIQDITKIKELDNMKNDFISTVAHEFRTPLTSITMAINLLVEEEKDVDKLELLDSTLEDTTRLTKLVNDLLDISKIQSGKIVMTFEEFPLDKIIGDSLKKFKLQFNEFHIQSTIDISENIPNVSVDYNYIIRVIINLVSNAIRYVPHDGTGRIDIFARKTGDNMVLVKIKDNGVGISKDLENDIFEKFVQIGKDKSSSGGAGLGLSICKEIIIAHGGQIWVESKENEGCQFMFTLSGH